MKVSELRELLKYDYETGLIYFRERTPDQFNNPTFQKRVWSCNKFNSRCANKPAFTSVKPNGYLSGGICNKTFLAHRVAWALFYGDWPEGDIDHIDHNKQNNRISNLRIVTKAENNRNLPSYGKVLGVNKYHNNKYRVTIGIKGKTKHLGYFDDFMDAVKVRKEAEKKYKYHSGHGI